MDHVRTRIPPSPTGQDLHMGNAYTALINHVFAKKNNGEFIIRIEDTDRTRFVEGSEERILASLKWLGITYDEGPDIGGPYAPYRQSERLALFQQHAEALVASGHAYYCFCTTERLELMRKDQEAKHLPPMYDGTCKKLDPADAKKRVATGEKHVIRMNFPDEGVTTFTDLVRGEISFENKLIDDQVLLKSDGFPTYHLAVVVDDHIMKISHIVRGEEWISSTPKQVLLYQFFGWELPVFAHLPVLRNPDRSKLSKRKNAVWVSWYREQGFLPEVIRNYLGTMAWAHPEGKEIFSTEEMTRVFDLTQIRATAPIFDVGKLRWMNGEYLRTKTDGELKQFIYQHVHTLKPEHEALVKKIIPLIKDRMKILSEFWSLAGFFFETPKEFERPLKDQPLKIGCDALGTSEWNHAAMEKSVRAAADKVGVKAKDVFMELRLAVTGKTVGPPLLESLEILGKDETMKRLGL